MDWFGDIKVKRRYITLNQSEQLLSFNVAILRHKNARTKAKPNQRMGDQSDLVTDLNGIGGEIAACRAFGVYPDLDTDVTELPKYDFISKTGKKVDVKTTHHKTGRLLAVLNKQVEDCDIYLLVIGMIPHYELIGYAKAEHLIQEGMIDDLGHGPGYVMGQDHEHFTRFSK